MIRRKSRVVKVDNCLLGGEAPISVQTMTKTDTRDVKSTVRQIKQIAEAGGEIVRVAVPDMAAAEALGEIKKQVKIPLVADIHFDYRLAIKMMEKGIDKIRINPGNIGGKEKIRLIIKMAKERNIPVRIGINIGSLEKDILRKYDYPCAEGMAESALKTLEIFEEMNFHQIVISLKGSDIPMTISAYRQIAEKVDYPLHLGITEAGTILQGSIKSAIGIGVLLNEGIGDTIRVSLTADPVKEIKVGFEILKSLGLREYGPTIISCPTCGRCKIDLLKIVKQVEGQVKKIKKPLKIAVMGCVVNGPGEAREADIGIAGGKGMGLIFRKGEVIRKVKEKDLVKVLIDEVTKM
ncbi:MAG: flavodoxin-dependent (E)-4-hydroxy-3-methylbut-2-enyl-diphosphate synthase [Candidatus Edwardsbacteria bacterium]